jgi:nucleotide-binding universal stress UspA family protein
MTAPSRILVGVDGSVHAEGALRWATDLGAALGAEVIAVHALGMLSNLRSRAAPNPSQEHHEEVRRLLENEWTQALRSAGVSYRCVLVDGNPVLALMHVAEEQDASLIVVGTRGAGGFPGLQLGSTSHQLLQHATVPVVAVPHQ